MMQVAKGVDIRDLKHVIKGFLIGDFHVTYQFFS